MTLLSCHYSCTITTIQLLLYQCHHTITSKQLLSNYYYHTLTTKPLASYHYHHTITYHPQEFGEFANQPLCIKCLNIQDLPIFLDWLKESLKQSYCTPLVPRIPKLYHKWGQNVKTLITNHKNEKIAKKYMSYLQ